MIWRLARAGFTVPFFHGVGVFLPWGIVPYPVPINIVLGGALEVPKFEGAHHFPLPGIRECVPCLLQHSRQNQGHGSSITLELAQHLLPAPSAVLHVLVVRHPGCCHREACACALPAGDTHSAQFHALVDKYHSQYTAALTKLFDDHKEKFAPGATLEIVE